ncbi:MAG TPA: dipeptidase, partial [Phnomibacter sp.]|nr:dipeptidase [Phnomibacter sp.]
MKWLALMLMTAPAMAQTSNKLHQKAIVVDTHNDFPSAAINKGVSLDMSLKGKTHSDLDRLQQGGVDVQIFSIWCDGDKKEPYAWANREIDSVHAWAQRNPQRMMLVGNPKELEQAVRQKKLATMMGVEGGHMIEDDLGKLEALYNRGVRYMTLTWNNSTAWATSALDETKPGFTGKKGLTDFGKAVVKKMNELGMLVDLSHVGEQTFYDAMATTSKPVLVSHSCVHALCPIFRNLKDDQIKAIGKNGGVIHLNFFSGFVDSTFMPRYTAFLTKRKTELDSLVAANPQIDKDYLEMQLLDKYKEETLALRPTLDQLMDHMDYIVKLVGIDHVGLGSDFDGISSAPQGLDGVENFPL